MHDRHKNDEQSRDISAVPVHMGFPFCFSGDMEGGDRREGKDMASNK